MNIEQQLLKAKTDLWERVYCVALEELFKKRNMSESECRIWANNSVY